MQATLAVAGRWGEGPPPSSPASSQPNPAPHAPEGSSPGYREELLEVLRVVAVAGIGVGILVAGLGGRLVMYLLRLTSPDSVRGVLSDDGFVIGRFTLSGTYHLAMIGAAVGIIGAAAYVAVAPWLVGPSWFRRLTVGAVAAAIGGASVIHADGVDFQVITPTWFALGLFILLPLVCGIGLAVAVDRTAARESWTRRGRTAWALPAVLTAIAAIEVWPVVVLMVAIVAVLLPVRRLVLAPLESSRRLTLAVRVAYASVAAAGVVALAADLGEFA